MKNLWQDIRFGVRILMRRPSVTAIAVLTLALGIGANTAIFSVVDAVLLRPLPYKDPSRLVLLQEDSPQVAGMSISMADFDDWRTMNTVFDAMAPYQADSVVLTGMGDAERLQMRNITAGLLPTLGVQPILGRALTPDDDKVGAAPVVLLSDSFWSRKFGRDPNVIGKPLTLDGEIYTIVGVLPSSHFHTSWHQFSVFSSLWRHEDTLGGPKNRGSHPGIYAIAHLKPGVTIEQAQRQMHDIADRLVREYPKTNTGTTATVVPLLDAIVGDERPGLLVVMAAAAFVLLIACANVANLMLARANERQKEMAIRAAMGASRPRLIRQLLTESMLLGIAGGALGLAAAYACVGVLTGTASANLPRVEDVSVDYRVLLFCMAASLLTALFFGIIPAVQSSRADVHDALKEGDRGTSAGAGRRRVRSVLVIAEIAISVVLLIGAGLMIKSLYRVLRADPGFEPAHAVATSFSMPDATYKDDTKKRQFVDQLVAKLAAVPGVQAAGFKNPLMGGWQNDYIIEGRPMPEPGKGPSTDMSRMTPDAFRAMGIQLVRGRFFTPFDNEKGEAVCIIDTTLAQNQWPGDNPLGKHLAVSGTPEKPAWMSIVGVVSHTKNYGVDQPSRVETYVPFDQMPASGGSLVIRYAGDSSGLTPAIRAAARSLDPDVPVGPVRTLGEIVGENTAPRRLSVILLTIFAGLALILAAIGIYGVMSYVVTQRSHEIGIRIALGAEKGDVLRLVLGSGMSLLGIGVVAGLASAFFLTRLVQSLLFEVKATDAATFIAIPLLLGAVALAACYLPARNATRVDPIIALREE
jgi:putative ABC transport system permease protein